MMSPGGLSSAWPSSRNARALDRHHALHDDNVFVTSRAPAPIRWCASLPRFGRATVYARRILVLQPRCRAVRAHHELTNPAARVQAFSRLHYNAGQRLRLVLDHGYLDTTAPAELNLGTALAAARIRTTRMSRDRRRVSPLQTGISHGVVSNHPRSPRRRSHHAHQRRASRRR